MPLPPSGTCQHPKPFADFMIHELNHISLGDTEEWYLTPPQEGKISFLSIYRFSYVLSLKRLEYVNIR